MFGSDDSRDGGAFLALMGGLTGDHQVFPPADAEDLMNGAKRIPGEVTDARRAGRMADMSTDKDGVLWTLEDGTVIR